MHETHRLAALFHDRNVLDETDISTFFMHVVQGLLQDNLEAATSYEADGKSIQALALIDRHPSPGSHFGYHYAYEYVDTVAKTVRSGIVVANPHIAAPFGGIYPRGTTSRHYRQEPGGVVTRQDSSGRRRIYKVTLSDKLDHPLKLRDPNEDFVTRDFKKDMLDVCVSSPIRPISNILHELVTF
jgi:hypothetical protein